MPHQSQRTHTMVKDAMVKDSYAVTLAFVSRTVKILPYLIEDLAEIKGCSILSRNDFLGYLTLMVFLTPVVVPTGVCYSFFEQTCKNPHDRNCSFCYDTI